MSDIENNGKQRRLGGRSGKGFPPGQSGNPGGRPKGQREFRLRCREFMTARGWALLEKLATTKGREQIHALKFIAEQGFGRAAQSIEMSGDASLRIIV